LLLHKNASLPWLILVPFTDAIALYQLAGDERSAIEQQWNALAAWVHQRYACKRVNVAAIGNLVPQLHLHIIGRNESDPCWPGVVWGQTLPEATWTPEALAKLSTELQAAFSIEMSE
jgi:diadenosine tetraphosphate (Ap4A) HIT family hydrolase